MNTSKSASLTNSRRVMLSVFIFVAMMSLASTAFAQDAWNHTNSPRFQLLGAFANQAVFDRETDLVWERSPSPGAFTWSGAQDRCNRLVVGRRMGYRVPTIQELTSLLSIGSSPDNLEPGNPFIAPPTLGQAIWSSTTSAIAPGNAWTMNLPGSLMTLTKPALARCWCVRFRQGPDAQ